MIKKSKGILLILPIIIVFLIFSGFAQDKKVYDYASILTQSEVDKLQENCIKTAADYQLDVAILTIDDSSVTNLKVYAADFYEAKNYGYEEPRGTGIIFSINMGTRDFFIATSGNAIQYFNDSDINNMINNVTPSLSSGNYYKALNIFLNDIGTYIGVDSDIVSDGGIYVGNLSTSESSQPADILVPLFISAIISAIIVAVMILNAGGKTTVSSFTYLDNGSTKIRAKSDTYTHTTTTTRTIDTGNSGGSSGGGSSTFSSSSGGSFGGGGGKF